jgi:hypothetical protein
MQIGCWIERKSFFLQALCVAKKDWRESQNNC